MKQLIVNGVHASESFDDGVIEDVINRVNSRLFGSNQVVSSVRINGSEWSEDHDPAMAQKPIKDIDTIEIFTSNPAELALETLGTLELYSDRLVAYMAAAADQYAAKNLIQGDDYFLKAIDGIDLFVQTVGGIKAALRCIHHPVIMNHEAVLTDVMSDLLAAKQENNYVALVELLGTELVEHINSWKKQVFPIFKSTHSA